MAINNYISYLINLNKLKKIKLIVSDIDGVMTDAKLIFDNNGIESKVFNALDGIGISMLLKANIRLAVISGSASTSIIKRFEKFKKENFQDLILNTENKKHALLNLMKKYGLERYEIAYIGDDIIDIEAIKYAGVSFSPKNAIKEVKKISNIILSRKGGDGAFREMSDMILKAKGIYNEIIKNYNSL